MSWLSVFFLINEFFWSRNFLRVLTLSPLSLYLKFYCWSFDAREFIISITFSIYWRSGVNYLGLRGWPVGSDLLYQFYVLVLYFSKPKILLDFVNLGLVGLDHYSRGHLSGIFGETLEWVERPTRLLLFSGRHFRSFDRRGSCFQFVCPPGAKTGVTLPTLEVKTRSPPFSTAWFCVAGSPLEISTL